MDFSLPSRRVPRASSRQEASSTMHFSLPSRRVPWASSRQEASSTIHFSLPSRRVPQASSRRVPMASSRRVPLASSRQEASSTLHFSLPSRNSEIFLYGNPNYERRRRVQILGDNGMVDLEEHLGLISDEESDEEIASAEEPESDGGPRIAIQTSVDDDGRMILESSLLRNGISEIQGRDDSFASTRGEAHSYEQGQAVRSEGIAQDLRPRYLEDAIEVGMPEQGCTASFGSHQDSQNSVDRSSMQGPKALAERPGGRRVVELVAAWDGLARKLPAEFSRSSGSDLLLRALKFTVMALQHSSADGHTPLCRAIAVAHILADLEMDAEVISTGLLREVVDAGLASYAIIEQNFGGSISRLLDDCSRVRHSSSRVKTLDDDSAKALRKFCLTFQDIRAVVVELASQLDTMRHICSFPRYQQQILALETMQIYAPLAHALGTGAMALELEDLGFRVLFPDSYSYVEKWLTSHWADGSSVVDEFNEQLSAALEKDSELQSLVAAVSVLGRYKSRFSTMRKLLNDGRKPEEIYDVLGLRVIIEPKGDDDATKEREHGVRACYRAMKVAMSLWKEIPGRVKDYIANPKQNGYESLHFAVYVTDQNNRCPPVEIQIRTTEMDAAAVSGDASHSLYKGGITDPSQIRELKLIMLENANANASRFGEVAGNAVGLESGDAIYHDENHLLFKMFDKNQDGVISLEEFQEVICELGADEEDAVELMAIVDLNTDGSVSPEEFRKFRHQIQISQNLAGVDREYSSQLGSKLKGSGETLTRNFTETITQNLEKFEPRTDTGIHSGQCSGILPTDPSCEEIYKQSPVSLRDEGGSSERHNNITLQEGSVGTMTVEVSTSRDVSGHDNQSILLMDSSCEEIYKRMTLSLRDEVGTSERRNNTTLHGGSEGTTTVVDSTSSDVSGYDNQKSLTQVGKPRPNLVRPIRTTGHPSLQESPVVLLKLDKDMSKWPISAKPDIPEKVKVAINVDEGSKESVTEHQLSKFRQLLAADNLIAARDLVIKMSEQYPDSTKVLVHHASLERKCGNRKAASALYAQAMALFEFKGDFSVEYVRALQAWATLEAQAGNPRRARYLFTESIIASEKGDFDSSLRGAGVYGLHGWALFEEKCGNWSKARDLLKRAANLQPGNAVVHQSRASLESRVHNYSEARLHFRRAVDAAPDDVRCWHAWALFEASQGKLQTMRQLFKQALVVDPKNLHSLQAWAHHEGLIGTEESRSKARKLYQDCVDIDACCVYCWQSWGILEQDSGNVNGARVLFEQGLEKNPESVPCLQAYGHMERKCGNLEAAEKLLRRALVVEPENAASLMELALIQDTLGNVEAALDLYWQAARVDKKKSLITRRMFESRKKELQESGSLPKQKVAGYRWRKNRTKRDVANEASIVHAYDTDEFESKYERIYSVATSSHSDR